MGNQTMAIAEKANERESKQMLCVYCAHSERGEKSTCAECEYNPDLSDCFEFGESAKKLMGKRVLNTYGCANLVAELNTGRLNRIAAVCDNQTSVADSPVTDDNRSDSSGGRD